jgi:hypothetical protein
MTVGDMRAVCGPRSWTVNCHIVCETKQSLSSMKFELHPSYFRSCLLPTYVMCHDELYTSCDNFNVINKRLVRNDNVGENQGVLLVSLNLCFVT